MLGVIGCGNLGSQIGLRALKGGLRVVAYDPRGVPAAFESAASIADVVAKTSKVVSVVPNDAALRSVIGDLVATQEKILHVSCSTVSPEVSREAAVRHVDAGQCFAATPVFGRPENVRDDQASFVVSGPDRADAAKVLSTISPRIFDFGDDPGAANVVKICGNFMIAASIQVMAEGLAIADINNVNRNDVMDMLSSTIFDCPIFRGYGHRVSRRDHKPGGFSLENGLKDVNLAVQTSRGRTHPFAAALQARFHQAKDAGLKDYDWSAVALQTKASL